MHYRLTTRKPKDLLIAWIHHLIANHEQETESVLITAEKSGPKVDRFGPVSSHHSEEHLRGLLQLYWRGLSEPLPFFPRSSLAFVEQMLNNKNGPSPLQKAQAKWRRSPEPWEPDRGERPEADDPHFRFVFRNVAEPLDDDFQQLALQIFVPVLKGIQS